ncbi:hypothetical protein ASD81_15815 [Nocardioides sp. Root614]|nr:hypothetical protein ASD81_15815 [Nocardioides sp. Root614]KRA87586.1 hypothetical protein ASD84_16090 [Nocardioides sp. Root682]
MEGDSRGRAVFSVDLSRHAEVGQDNFAERVQEDVLRLDVAMQDALVVQRGHGSAQLHANAQYGLGVESPLTSDPIPEGTAGVERSHDVGTSKAVDPGFEHRHDVGVRYPAQGSELTLKSRCVRVNGVDKHLYGDHSVESVLPSAIDLGETATADQFEVREAGQYWYGIRIHVFSSRAGLILTGVEDSVRRNAALRPSASLRSGAGLKSSNRPRSQKVR